MNAGASIFSLTPPSRHPPPRSPQRPQHFLPEGYHRKSIQKEKELLFMQCVIPGDFNMEFVRLDWLRESVPYNFSLPTDSRQGQQLDTSAIVHPGTNARPTHILGQRIIRPLSFIISDNNLDPFVRATHHDVSNESSAVPPSSMTSSQFLYRADNPPYHHSSVSDGALPTTSAYDRFEQQSHCPLSKCDSFYPIIYQIATNFTVVGLLGYDCNYELSNCFSPTIEVNFTPNGLLQGVRFIRVEEI
ncbi:uncharacterized protein CEXT_584521 [Caerostris extrusa]|uniref:Uncharacterized protein n=1 Tax=Caerostris extrusa TaxID=172846 RepID=A0AAV4U6Y9_CAEEX|nr:uncharacterized protein CEXT_584521 [Caerostris extrusa]